MSSPTSGASTASSASTSSDTTPTTGGALPYAASGAAGADREDAPDVAAGSVHRPGQAPGVDVRSGPAVMMVGEPKKDSSKQSGR